MSLQLSLRHPYEERAKQTLPPTGGRGTEQKGKIHPHGKADQTGCSPSSPGSGQAAHKREPRFWVRQRWWIIYHAQLAPRRTPEIAELVGVSERTVRRVIASYNREGPAGDDLPKHITDFERRAWFVI